MRENRPYGSEGGEGNLPDPYCCNGSEVLSWLHCGSPGQARG
jgi:hypothetical protein